MSSKHHRRSDGRRAMGVLGAVMVLALAACGSSSDSSADDGPTTKKAAVTTTVAGTSATTTAAESTTSSTTPTTGTPVLTATSLGPLQIGQSLVDAKATGWIGTDIGTCELAGTPPAGTYGFSLDGPNAPDGLDGSVSIVGDKVAVINVRGGARMANGVTIEPFGTWTPDQATKALDQAGYDTTYETLIETNDLAKATSPDGNLYELSLTEAGVTVAVPSIELCD